MKTTVKLSDNKQFDSMSDYERERFFKNQLKLRSARKQGDQERVNNYVLGQLNYFDVNYVKL